MAQALKESMPDDMSRPSTSSTSSGSADNKRTEADFAFGLESAPAAGVGSYNQVAHAIGHSTSLKPSRHIGNFQPMMQETPSVLLPSVTIASPPRRAAPATSGQNNIPVGYQSLRPNTCSSPSTIEYPRSARPQLHHSRTGFSSIGPVSPPYTPVSNKQAMSMPTMVDLSATPDLVTPMTGFNFDNGAMMSYNRNYPSRQDVGKYPTMALPSHSQGLLPPATFVHGNGYHSMSSASTPASPIHPGNLRRTISHGPQLYAANMAPSPYAPQTAQGGLVGLGIMMPTGETDLFDGLRPQGQNGAAIYSGM